MGTEATLKKDWRRRFLAVYEESCNVTLAARAAGIDRRTPYKERKKNPEFAAQMEAAQEVAIANLEEVAYQRAATTSDTLLIFLLKANVPGKYRENVKIEHGGTINHEVRTGIEAEIERIAEELVTAGAGDAARADAPALLEAGGKPGPAAP